MSAELTRRSRPQKPTPRQNTATSLALLALAPEAWTPCLYVGHCYELPGPRSPFIPRPALSASACVSDSDGSLWLSVRLHVPGGSPREEWEQLRKDVQDFLMPRGFEAQEGRDFHREREHLPDLDFPTDLHFDKAYTPGPDMQQELAEVHAFLSRFEAK